MELLWLYVKINNGKEKTNCSSIDSEMGKMRKRISFIESVIVSPVKNTFALNLVYFFSLKSKGRIKKIKRGRGRKKRNLHIFFLAANENYHLLHKLERGRSKRKRGKYPRRKKTTILRMDWSLSRRTYSWHWNLHDKFESRQARRIRMQNDLIRGISQEGGPVSLGSVCIRPAF